MIPKAYESMLPAAEPLPHPTLIKLSFAQFTKSETTKKYSGNPISFTTLSSWLALDIISSDKSFPYLFLSPFQTNDSRYLFTS